MSPKPDPFPLANRKPRARPPDKAAQIARINELSQLARTAWFSLLGYLVFVGITLLGVKDVDFFVPSRQTDLPLVGVQIPTASFFWTAPILGAALYTYLHLILIKLWDAHGDARTSDADATHHWLVGDFVLIRQKDSAALERPLVPLTDWITRALVWVAGPLVMSYAWWRSMPAHNEWLTLLIAACLWLTLVVGFTSWWRAENRLVRCQRASRSRIPRRAAAIGAAVLLVTTSWLRTEGGLEYAANGAVSFANETLGTQWLIECSTGDVARTGEPEAMMPACLYPNGDRKPNSIIQLERVHAVAWIPKTSWFDFNESSWILGRWLRDDDDSISVSWNPLAAIDLTGAELVPLPPDWRTPQTAQSAFRKTWCERQGLAMLICGQPAEGEIDHLSASMAADRLEWCKLHGSLSEDECVLFFVQLEYQFSIAWNEERESTRGSLAALDLSGQDLRRADARGASLVGANLRDARLEGADLRAAMLEGTDLSGAWMDGTSLVESRFMEPTLTYARLESSDLRWAELNGADLWGAKLAAADLRNARLADADLRWSDLQEADLRHALLTRADFAYSDLRRSDWYGVRSEGTVVTGADLRGARNLNQDLLDRFIGSDETLLPDGMAPDTNAPYTVPSCWIEPPPQFDAFLRRKAGLLIDDVSSLAAVAADYVCLFGLPAVKSGTPCSLELTRDQCLDPEQNRRRPLH